VLVSAFTCNPSPGSEAGVGWGWGNAIGRHHEAWVLVADVHREDIQKAVPQHPELAENAVFH